MLYSVLRNVVHKNSLYIYTYTYTDRHFNLVYIAIYLFTFTCILHCPNQKLTYILLTNRFCFFWGGIASLLLFCIHHWEEDLRTIGVPNKEITRKIEKLFFIWPKKKYIKQYWIRFCIYIRFSRIREAK